MRCLYCGNELALLRKLTGYGEFCSEAHRQKYQEQYNRLALTRLLQAQEPEPERPPLHGVARGGHAIAPGKARKALEAGTPVTPQASSPREEWTPVSSPSPAARTIPISNNGAPPDPSGFLPHLFEPAVSQAGLCVAEPVLTPASAVFPDAFFGHESGTYVPAILGNTVPEPATHQPEPASGSAGPADAPASGAVLPGPGPLWGELEAAKSLDLTLERVAGVPVRGESVIPFEFVTEFNQTIGDLLCPVEPPTETAELQSAAVAPTVAPPTSSVIEPAARLRSEAHPSGSGLAPRKPSPLASGPKQDRPPVVINWAALGMVDPDAEQGPSQAEEPAPETGRPVSDAAGEGSPAEAEAPPASTALELSQPAEPDRVVDPTEPQSAVVDTPPQAITRQATPTPCNVPARVALALSSGARTPTDDGEFDAPSFEIRPPALVTCPLRPKLVFGPNPHRAGTPTVPDTHVPGMTAEQGRGQADLATGVSEAGPISLKNVPPAPTGSVASAAKAAPDAAAEALPEPVRETVSVTTTPLAGTPASQPPPARSDKRRPVPETMDLEALRMEMERQIQPAQGALPTARRIAVLMALLLAVLLVVYLVHEALSAKTGPTGSNRQVEAFGPGLVSGEGGWSVDWAGQAPAAVPGRQVYIFRPSLAMSDYRFEFQGLIESKGLGWVFRAANPRNYYAMKLEMVKAGLSPQVVLSRMAVINGEQTQEMRTELHMPVHLDTVYKVRTDVFGSTFKTYIQDELADTWVDDRLTSGGIGLLKDKDEAAEVRLIQLHGLRVAN